jgi:hypothetical protein
MFTVFLESDSTVYLVDVIILFASKPMWAGLDCLLFVTVLAC